MASPKAKVSAFDINLRKIMEEYAWKRYLKKIGYPFRLFARKKNFYFDMRWSYLNFSHKTDWKTDWKNPIKSAKNRPQSEAKVDTPTPNNQECVGAPIVLHQANYENRTPVEQKYTFSTTRETTASVSVEFQSNYSRGAETNIELSVPGDFLTVSAGVNGSLSVTETEGQSYEETHTWTTNTEISVEAGHKITANLKVHENTFENTFVVKTTMTLGKVWFPIMVRKRDKDDTVYTVLVTNLKNVFSAYCKDDDKDDTVDSNIAVKTVIGADNLVSYSVELTSKGRFKSISWTEQEVIVRSELLPDISPELKDMIKAKQSTQSRES